MNTINPEISMINDGFDYMATPMPHEDVPYDQQPQFVVEDATHLRWTLPLAMLAIPTTLGLVGWLICTFLK